MDSTKKHKKHAFGKNIYFLGQDADGINYWLEQASWDCGWYWGFGYIKSYTNNNNPSKARDISSHEHFDGLNRTKNINLYDAFKEKFAKTPLSNKELWTLCELMKSFYVAKNYAEMLHIGGAHYTSNPCKNIIKNEDELDRINKTVIPAICQSVYNLLTPNANTERK